MLCFVRTVEVTFRVYGSYFFKMPKIPRNTPTHAGINNNNNKRNITAFI